MSAMVKYRCVHCSYFQTTDKETPVVAAVICPMCGETLICHRRISKAGKDTQIWFEYRL